MLVLKEHNHFYYSGCHLDYLRKSYAWEDDLIIPKPLYFKQNQAVCLKIDSKADSEKIRTLKLETSYYIGLQYINEWKLPVLIEPKLNNKLKRLDFLGMLIEALHDSENFNHLGGLMEVDYDAEWIEVPAEYEVELTPFLIVQFLMIVKQIVKKGLKKSYYPKTENLRSRIKGKILVNQQLKQNVFKQRLTNTVCTYQEFGFDTFENQFLKYVSQIIYSFIGNFDPIFKSQLLELLNYNNAAFQHVSDNKFKSFEGKERNSFYKAYNIAFNLGNQILKMMDLNYDTRISNIKKYPPHWLDMSKLFELYTFKKLREKFCGEGEVKYHEKIHYQELDFIINTKDFKAVVDAKYKPRYKNGNPTKEDARQLAGYSRLNKVYEELGINEDQIIPVYFVYPKELDEAQTFEELIQTEDSVENNNLISILKSETSVREVKAYKKMFMQEVSMKTF